MNIKVLLVSCFLLGAAIAGLFLFGMVVRHGFTEPVIAGYAVLAATLLVVAFFAGKIKRWLK